MAEKEGFEPSIPFWGIHDFQSCALGQLRDFSMRRLRCQPGYNTSSASFCQAPILLFSKKFSLSVLEGKQAYFEAVQILTSL